MKKYYTQMLTRTALLLALCLVVQQFKSISQFITGPLVNLILLVAALAVGLYSGLAIAVLSPILAFLISPSPLMQAMPQLIALVALGNASIVVCAWALRHNKMFYLGLAAGALAKTAVLALGLRYVLVPLFGAALKPQMVTAATAMFGVNQLITAAIAGAIACVVWPLLKRSQGFVLQK